MAKFVATKGVVMKMSNGTNLLQLESIDKNFVIAMQEVNLEEPMSIEIKKYRSKRSLEQNAALWFLLTKLANAMFGDTSRTAVEEAYCIMLEEANASYQYLLAQSITENELRKVYRVIRKKSEREVNGQILNLYQCFPGSSKYDSKEMTELIKNTLLKLDEYGVVDSEIEDFRRDNRYE